MASQNTGASIVCPAVCSGAHQRKHQRSPSLAIRCEGKPPVRAINHHVSTDFVLSSLQPIHMHRANERHVNEIFKAHTKYRSDSIFFCKRNGTFLSSVMDIY